MVKKRTLYGVSCLIVCMFWGWCLWHKNHTQGVFERYSSYIIYPFLMMHHAVIDPVKGWYAYRASYAELEHELMQLRYERDNFCSQVVKLQAQLVYYQEIKELADFERSQPNVVVPVVQIIAKNFSESQHYFLIDAGSNKGVQKEMIVVYKNALAGKISEVYPWYSKVVAITDKRCKVSACCSKTCSLGIHEGVNRLDCTQLKSVSHLDSVVQGDYVLSSGQGLVFPRGYALGYIVSAKPQGLYYAIDVKPLYDLEQIRYCTVIARAYDNLLPECQQVQSKT